MEPEGLEAWAEGAMRGPNSEIHVGRSVRVRVRVRVEGEGVGEGEGEGEG